MGGQRFDSKTLLSVVTGKLFVPSWQLYDLLDFMTGCEVWPGDVDAALEVVGAEIVSQCPALDVRMPDSIWLSGDAISWVEDLMDRVGWSHEVRPLPSGVWCCDHSVETVVASERYL